MNIADIIGPMDVNQALVAIGMGVSVTIITCASISRQSRVVLTLKHEEEMMKMHYQSEFEEKKLALAHERNLAELASNREIEFRRIDSGMIEATSGLGNPGNR